MKKKNSNAKETLLMVFAGFVIIALAVAVLYFRDDELPVRRPVVATPSVVYKRFPKLNAQVDHIFSKISDDVWVLDEAIDPQKTDKYEQVAKFSVVVNKEVLGLFEKYKNLKNVQLLKNQFGNGFRPTIFVRGVSAQLNVGEPDKFDSKYMDKLEICFFTKADQGHPDLEGQQLFYRHNWEALMVAAIKYDPIWFDGFVLHEMMHAHFAKDKALSSTARMGSDLWISEEVVAHGLEHEVLFQATKGEYGRLLDEITASKNVQTLDEFFDSLTVDDFKKLDGLFLTAGRREMNLRLTQYLYDLGNRFVAKKFDGDELEKQVIGVYRTILHISD